MFVYGCVHVSVVLAEAREGVKSPKTGITRSCESPDVDPGHWTQASRTLVQSLHHPTLNVWRQFSWTLFSSLNLFYFIIEMSFYAFLYVFFPLRISVLISQRLPCLWHVTPSLMALRSMPILIEVVSLWHLSVCVFSFTLLKAYAASLVWREILFISFPWPFILTDSFCLVFPHLFSSGNTCPKTLVLLMTLQPSEGSSLFSFLVIIVFFLSCSCPRGLTFKFLSLFQVCQQSMGHFLNWWMMWEILIHCGQCYPWHVVLDHTRKQAEEDKSSGQ